MKLIRVYWSLTLFRVCACVCVLSEKAVFRPSDEAVFTTLGVNTHLFACEPSELDSLVSPPETTHLECVSCMNVYSVCVSACKDTLHLVI